MNFRCMKLNRYDCNYSACIGDACESFIRDDYWKRRCEAAETVIAFMPINLIDEFCHDTYQEYQQILHEREGI